VHTYHGVPDDVTQGWITDPSSEPPSNYSRAVLAADSVVARAVTRTVVPSETYLRFLRDRLHIPEARLVHIDNGLLLPSPGVPLGPVRRLLSVGLLNRRKGLHHLLNAMAVAGLPPSVTLRVAGDGPERQPLMELTNRLGLADRVQFLGFRSDVHQLLAQADAFILPSEMEQQPLVLIEAMGAGKPIIATDVGGVREMMGDCGILVPHSDVPELARALRELVSSDDPSRWGRRAASRAQARFTVDHIRDRHLALYDDLILRNSFRVRGWT
jgi:glycosyltransferase involved in cell wall biosynthesis